MGDADTSVIHELAPRIVVFGVGGAGGNAVNNMIDSGLAGVEFVVANTDSQALTRAKTDDRIQLGARITDGLGAGARPEIGAQSAEDSMDEIRARLEGAHMVFITAGMGGGTGTGGAPVVARAAREMGVLTVAVITKPFDFEGAKRMRIAEEGVAALEDHVDTMIVIPNQNLFRIASKKTTFKEAFHLADEVLHSGVRGVTDLMMRPGLINLDFADVRTVMNEMGKAMMGTGEAAGERRAVDAAHAAVSNPLLDDVTLTGAKGVLINITGGYDMTLYEVDEAANEIRAEVDEDANIIVGSAFDEALEGRMRVSVVATGISPHAVAAARPAIARPKQPERPAPSAARAAVLLDAEDEVEIESGRIEERPSGFNLFGRRRRAVPDDTSETPEPAQAEDEPALRAVPPPARQPVATPDEPADLEDDFDDEELEIPAFLRRHG